MDSPSRNLARYIDELADRYISNLAVMIAHRLDICGCSGYHRTFNQVGFPTVRIMETNENYTQRPQDIRLEIGISYRDVIEHVNFDEDVDKFTLENVVRDNPYFGVSSSSDRRVESPVVFPGPAGAY